ncbi:hypothetical protein GCM10010411_76660 [Actinomadura fulvescens]|uniref:Uncharacterized protein n=1 Tax=Actinomadura fulvescens TaxID=46160 RepID=A0ABP6CUP1_9ACTN
MAKNGPDSHPTTEEAIETPGPDGGIAAFHSQLVRGGFTDAGWQELKREWTELKEHYLAIGSRLPGPERAMAARTEATR